MRKKQVLALMMSVATIASAFAGTGISAAAESADDMTITNCAICHLVDLGVLIVVILCVSILHVLHKITC